MEFLFHSVYHDGFHAKYFNVYKVDSNRFLAEPHHFNRFPEDDDHFVLIKEGNSWKTEKENISTQASYIGEEIDRFGNKTVRNASR